MGTIEAVFTAAAEGAKLFMSIFGARNSPSMQDNAKAATLQKIRDSVNQHIASGDIQEVASDGTP